MIERNRRGLSAEQKAELWKRWKAGQSLNEIGRALGKDHVVVHFVLSRHGGIAPPTRRRSRRVLTLAEREDISRGIASGCAMRVIARGLHRSPSTISREITRHGGRTQYRANAADQQAWESAVRPKPCLLATHSELQQMVASKLMQDWSPQQVSGWLKMEYPNDESLRVSHETIYRSLFIQARGALKQELVRHLRSKRRIRRSRHASVHGHSQGRIIDAISIRERPAEVEDRAVPGHWEGDLLRGAGNSHVVTLVERRSRFCMLVKVAGKDTATVVAALSQHVQQLPAALRRSLTWDRGLEMAFSTKASRWLRMYRFTSAIRRVPGSAARTKTPTGYCGNTCRRTPTCLRFRNQNSTQSLCVSIPDHDKPWDFELRRINCRPVLHRPLETTRLTGMWLYPGTT